MSNNSSKKTKEYLFEQAPIPSAVASLAVPTIIGVLVVIIYNLAGAYFVGRLNDENQVAAITLASPVFVLFLAVGGLFGIGGSSYIARLLGRKDYDAAKNTSAFVFYASAVAGLIVAVITHIMMPTVLSHLGATPATADYLRDYVAIMMNGSPLVILSFGMGQIARSEGAAKVAMGGMMIGTFINIALDPLFILHMGMGVKGAAYAAVIANFIVSIYYIVYFIRKSPWLSISPKHFTLSRTVVVNTLSVGTPAFVSNILMSLAGLTLNQHASAHGEHVVSAIGIVFRVAMLPHFIIMGLCQGVLPLVGYNYASGNRKRMMGVVNFTFITALSIGITLSIILAIASPTVVRFFLDIDSVVDMGKNYLRIILAGVPFMALGFMYASVFQALGKAIPALIITIARQGFVFIPMVIIGDRLLGASGLVLAQPVSDVISAVITLALFIPVRNEMRRREQEAG
jgi:putative MATE family efflux protein